jgi:hypothetical protein
VLGIVSLTLGVTVAARADTASVITIEGPSQETAIAGFSTGIDALLTIGGSPAPAGITVYDTRSAPDRTTTQFTTTTNTAGSFVFHSPYPAVGTYTDAISYPGDTASGISPAATADVVVTVRAPRLLMNLYVGGAKYADEYTRLDGTIDNIELPSVSVSGQVVHVTRAQNNSTATASWTLISNANGNFSLTDVPATPGTYTYTATVNGTAAFPTLTQQVTETLSASPGGIILNVPSNVTLGKAVSLTGGLGFESGDVADGTPITVTRTVAGSAATAVFTTDTYDYGTFSITDTPSAPGMYTYTASYDGPAVTAPATAHAEVDVRHATAASITPSATGIAYDRTVKLVIRVGTTEAPQTVSLLAQTIGSHATRTVKTATVASGGTMTVSVPLTSTTLFTAKVAGDTLDTAASATTTVRVAARIGAAISGRYTTTRIGSTIYSVYHHTATLKDVVTVTPNKHGQCVELQVYRYYSGAWHPYTTTGCTRLNSKSRASLALKLGTLGQFEVRASYVRSQADSSNVSTYGSWAYYKVVR